MSLEADRLNPMAARIREFERKLPILEQTIRGLQASVSRLTVARDEAEARAERAEAERGRLLELIGYMREPLEVARRQARPGEIPSNVEVVWFTGADTVVEMLNLLNAARDGEGGKER